MLFNDTLFMDGYDIFSWTTGTLSACCCNSWACAAAVIVVVAFWNQSLK